MNRKLHAQRRQGLTLIELIVVLLILVGLASLLVPMIPNMLGRTHTAVGAANMKEINKWVQTYEQLNFAFPNEWDSLLKTDGTLPVSYMPNDGTNVSGGDIYADTLQDGEVAALNAKGITLVHDFADAPEAPTFNPYAAAVTAPRAITTAAAGKKVAMLLDTTANAKMGLPLGGRYVVFGLGNRCTMVGRITSEPPLAFADEPGINASSYYARFLVIFQVGTSTGGMTPTYTPLSLAKYVGSLSLHPGSIDAAGQHIEEFYNIQKTK